MIVQSIWKLNPAADTPTWIYVTGSNATGGSTPGHPSARDWFACDGAPNSGAYCHGGYSGCKLLILFCFSICIRKVMAN